MAKPIPEHRDMLGRSLKIGDCVAYPKSNHMIIGTIKSMATKMATVVMVGAKMRWDHEGVRKYPHDLVLLNGPEVTMYLIKNSS